MTTSPTGGRGRRVSFAAFGLLLALGVGLLGWALAHQVGEPPTPAGARHTAAPVQPGPDAAASTDGGPTGANDSGTEPTGANDSGATGTAGGTVAPDTTDDEPVDTDPPVAALPASEPVHLRIPAIDVDSDLHPLGLNSDGTLQVPSGDLYEQAAWYDGSPTPGEIGPAVLEGHVTSQGSVPSVFFELGALVPGDLVEVERADGSTATFAVYGADSFPKDSFPKTTVYGNTSGPELRLITCGGTYDPQARAHVDNIVVFARLVPEA